MKKYDLIYHSRRKRKAKWFQLAIDNVIMSSYYSYNLGQKIRAQYIVQAVGYLAIM